MVTNRGRKFFESRRIFPKFAQTNGTVELLDPRPVIWGPT